MWTACGLTIGEYYGGHKDWLRKMGDFEGFAKDDLRGAASNRGMSGRGLGLESVRVLGGDGLRYFSRKRSGRRKGLLRVGGVWAILLGMQLGAGVWAQDKDKDKDKDAKPAEAAAAATPAAPKEESSVTEHTIKIGGVAIPYKATAATILLKNEKDEPTALMYYTAYTRSDVKDLSTRPIAFVYNGGPGSASVWLHMGSFSPKRVVTVNADATPPAPYKLVDNVNCLLDKTDLVFVDPVGTGFSHAVGKAQ